MAWLQLRISSAHPEFVEEILLGNGAVGVSFIDGEDRPVLEPLPGETPLWENTVTLGLFYDNVDLAPAQDALRELLPDGDTVTIASELIEDQDWVRAWLDHWHPLKFGEHLWVAPTEKIGEINDPEAIILKLDPGLAFGTGTHPTTALCLEWLSHQDLTGKTVLDYGCGSGILAIAALKLGAAHAICVDIDPQALTATENNAKENGVLERIRVMLPADFVPFPADFVIANILARPLISLAPLLASSVNAGGKIVLAGLLERQQEEVREAYATWFTSEPDQIKEGWTRLAGVCRIPSLISYVHISNTIATAGQPQAEHFALLARAGYKTVINLAVPTSSNFMPNEVEHCAQQGLDYIHLPVAWNNPTREDFEKFVTAMKSLSDSKSFIHCALNKRVSVFVFLYRVIELGETVEVASQEPQQIWAPNEIWSKFKHDMLAGFKP
ncbi:50S ribosomal protein L11 methyltransferase [Stenotrophobium rhamnosiphilum]|uniref:Ribosomal protein L11 methyltransferase n=1 Tax=Stenotrophobium rhamnosiphilum TaxID=2029166 RepID=A0A2T5MKA5_9GAMM|nr:50S ribosomal protein L11 methyltransferase [Stenotrophobium rhamnosiphilum]PTU33000.1 50S ribosomal protein L11 methyltransferase [Stenotrophobium rhamnosiphilum]